MEEKKILTKKQQRVYNFIKKRMTASGKAPTLSEIAGEIEVSSLRTVTQYLESMERKGVIVRNRYAQRGIRLVEDRGPAEEMVQIPLFGSAGCGNPSIIAQQVFDEYVMISSDMINGNRDDLFVIRAIGESMQDSGISDGDLVLAQRTEDVQTGDRVIAIVEGDAVIKRLTLANDVAILNPETKDPQYHPIILKRDNFHIFGKVIRIIRIQKSEDYQIVPIE